VRKLRNPSALNEQLGVHCSVVEGLEARQRELYKMKIKESRKGIVGNRASSGID